MTTLLSAVVHSESVQVQEFVTGNCMVRGTKNEGETWQNCKQILKSVPPALRIANLDENHRHTRFLQL